MKIKIILLLAILSMFLQYNVTVQNASLLFADTTVSQRADQDTKNWNIEKLDTAKNASYLSAIEKDVILEMNMVRCDPKKYAELYIKTELQYYNGRLFKKPGEITLQTNEGREAAESCIAELSRMRSAGILKPEIGLARGAADHTKDQSKSGRTGHNGSDGSTPFTRIKRYGGGYTTAGENIAYGGTRGRELIVQLLIDDGVPGRGHRKNIMSRDFTQTGVSFATHSDYRTMCVINYANGYVSK